MGDLNIFVAITSYKYIIGKCYIVTSLLTRLTISLGKQRQTEMEILIRMRHLTSNFDLTLASNMQTIKNVL